MPANQKTEDKKTEDKKTENEKNRTDTANLFKNPDGTEKILKRLRDLTDPARPLRLMEICGTHTMSIARAGLRGLLAPSIRLISGPGCPVCVTPSGAIDQILALSESPDLLITSYGDLLRVPGSRRGDCLLYRRARGAAVEAVYSPMDALRLAEEQPQKEVVFLGVGFETTAPGTAACILEAARRQIPNFSVLCLLKQTEPALRALIASDDFAVDGFLCPGHVAAVIGSDAFAFLPEEYGIPAVVAGFEAADLLYSILELTALAAAKTPALRNTYVRLVKPQGNPAAVRLMRQVLTPAADTWRGLGVIENGGLAIRPEYAAWDAARKFSLPAFQDAEPAGCRCASVIRGALSPDACPLFGTACTPADPVGPCMVSGEGACAAAWRYGPAGLS